MSVVAGTCSHLCARRLARHVAFKESLTSKYSFLLANGWTFIYWHALLGKLNLYLTNSLIFQLETIVAITSGPHQMQVYLKKQGFGSNRIQVVSPDKQKHT